MNPYGSLRYQLIQLFSFSLATVSGIIGGRPTDYAPFYALVILNDQKCGGTLVADDIVLTAARCVYNHPKGRWALATELYVLHGDFSVPNGWILKYYSCVDFEIHSSHTLDGSQEKYDVVLIKLEDKIFSRSDNHKTTMYDCVFKQDMPYKQGTFIGMGLNHQNPNRRPAQLMEAELRLQGGCGKHNKNLELMYPGDHVCYSAPGAADPCNGDLGSPILFKKDGEFACLIGVSTFIPERCDNTDYPAIFTTVEAFKHWMKRRIKLNRKELWPRLTL